MALPDRYDDMSPSELVEEFELRYPEMIKPLEEKYPGIIDAIADEDFSEVEEDELDELLEEMREILTP